MQWLRRLLRAPDRAPGADRAPSPAGADIDDWIVCAVCGTPLGLDLDDDPVGEAEQPLCGECHRARHFDVLPGRR